MAGLLTSSLTVDLPVISITVVIQTEVALKAEVTAAGTVPDLHRIPFSFCNECVTKTNNRWQK
jgi:hypothetical protein